MPAVIETTVYQYDELTDSAKEKARDWFRKVTEGSNDFAESVIEDAEQIATILGIEISTRTAHLYGGGTRQEPQIYYSGFYHQGSGACFGGYYRYAKGAARSIREYAPQDATLHRIADALQRAQKRYLYSLTARIEANDRSMCVGVTVLDRNEDALAHDDASANLIEEAISDFAHWIYKHLQDAYEWETADEQVEEDIRANEYTFTEDGDRF